MLPFDLADLVQPAALIAVALLSVLGPCAYLLITSLNLAEGIAAHRNRKPCAVRFLKALAHAILFLKLLML